MADYSGKAVDSHQETRPQLTRQAPNDGDLFHAEKFAQAARDLGCDDDDDAFKGVLQKLVRTKPALAKPSE